MPRGAEAARQAHNLKVRGSSPLAASTFNGPPIPPATGLTLDAVTLFLNSTIAQAMGRFPAVPLTLNMDPGPISARLEGLTDEAARD